LHRSFLQGKCYWSHEEQETDTRGQNKIVNILKRIQEEDDNAQDFDTALEDLDLEDPNLFDKLPKEQQEDFKRALKDGRLSSLIEIADPWWNLPPVPIKPLVQVVSTTKGDDDIEDAIKKIPKITENLPPLLALTKAKPSPYLSHNLIDILYSYCYMFRLFNADIQADLEESLKCIYELSAVIRTNAVFQSTTSCLESSIEASVKPAYKVSIGFSIAALQDVAKVLKCKAFVLSALSDLLESYKLKSTSKEGTTRQPSKLDRAQKKMYFYLVWANEQTELLFKVLASEVETEYNKKIQLLKSSKDNSS